MKKLRETISRASVAVCVVQDPLTSEIGYVDLGQPPTVEALKTALDGVVLFCVCAVIEGVPQTLLLDAVLPDVQEAQKISAAVAAHFVRSILGNSKTPTEEGDPSPGTEH